MNLSDPVIIMGMHKSGTTLLSEMVHKGGISMYSGGHDPSYDDGIKYERPICQEINCQVLGVEKLCRPVDPIWIYPRQPISPTALQRLAEEVKDQAWGFKDPRTTFTYSSWLDIFPKGPRIYTYRGHEEVVHRMCRGKKRAYQKTRRVIEAWLRYNEQILKNFALDQKAGRPAALVRYEELMTHPGLCNRLEKILGIKLFDARDLQLYRSKVGKRPREFLLNLFTLDYNRRLSRVYASLAANRVVPD